MPGPDHFTEQSMKNNSGFVPQIGKTFFFFIFVSRSFSHHLINLLYAPRNLKKIHRVYCITLVEPASL